MIGIPLARAGAGPFRLFTGGWLMYLAYAVAVDFSLGYHWRT